MNLSVFNTDPLSDRVLSSLITTENLRVLRDESLNREDFSDQYREAFDFINHFYETYSKYPDKDQVAETTGLDLESDPEPFSYVCEKFRERRLGRMLESDVKNIAKHLRDADPNSALRSLFSITNRYQSSIVKSGCMKFREDGLERFKKLLSGEEIEYGIDTPWETLTNAINGFMNGEFIVFAALASGGKSWISAVLATHFQKLGLNTLFVTMENQPKAMMKRLDAAFYEIEYKDMRTGELDVHTADRVLQKAGSLTKGEIFLYGEGDIPDVSIIKSLVDYHKADVVIIDGAYRFKSKGNSDWEQSKSTINIIQSDANKTNIPWICTTQMNLSDKKIRSRTDSYEVRYSKDWIIAPSVFVTIRADDDERAMKVCNMDIKKIREGTDEDLPSFKCRFDLSHMKFGELNEDEIIVSGVEY